MLDFISDSKLVYKLVIILLIVTVIYRYYIVYKKEKSNFTVSIKILDF